MWPNPQETVDLVTCTKEIVNGKLYSLCSEYSGANKVKLTYCFENISTL